MSASHAIERFLHYPYLKKLSRFILWHIHYENVSRHEALESLKGILEKSIVLVNPNKEGYYFDCLPPKRIDLNHNLVLIKVSQNEAFLDPHIERFLISGNNRISKIEQALLWELIVTKPEGKDIADVEKELKEQVILTTSRQKGILVHPISESFDILPIQDYYSKT